MNRRHVCFNIAIAFALVVALITTALGQAHENVLHTFTGPDGENPYGNLVIDAFGNMFGVAQGGGQQLGTVFELSPKSGGGWNFNVVHTFAGADGWYPKAGLTMDHAGNLYGTTYYGGAYQYGCVFELSPSSNGQWTETVLYSFGPDTSEGYLPAGGVVFDTNGNLYGTTFAGGQGNCELTLFGCGTVFELTPSDKGWTETAIYKFSGGDDGFGPESTLVIDGKGNLFGTTVEGGNSCYSDSCGTVFELTPSNGNWQEKVIHRFHGGGDGAWPYAGVTLDSSGNLYGAAYQGGTISCADSYGCGTVFRLSPPSQSSGEWSFNVVYHFKNNASDASNPYGNVALDNSGRIFGTTNNGGSEDSGTVFALTELNGKMHESILYSFSENDGTHPYSGVTLDRSGHIYGATSAGGDLGCSANGYPGCGVIFELTK